MRDHYRAGAPRDRPRTRTVTAGEYDAAYGKPVWTGIRARSLQRRRPIVAVKRCLALSAAAHGAAMKAWRARGSGQRGAMTEHHGPLALRTHAMIEPIVGVLFIAAPWIFGFSDASDATTVSIVLGALVLLTGLTTRWRAGVVKLLPLAAHRAMDLVVAVVAIVSPFVLGFSDNGAATRFLIIMGVLEIGATLMTNWDDRDEFAIDANHPARGERHAPMAR
jgi:hypothetical protein